MSKQGLKDHLTSAGTGAILAIGLVGMVCGVVIVSAAIATGLAVGGLGGVGIFVLGACLGGGVGAGSALFFGDKAGELRFEKAEKFRSKTAVVAGVASFGAVFGFAGKTLYENLIDAAPLKEPTPAVAAFQEKTLLDKFSAACKSVLLKREGNKIALVAPSRRMPKTSELQK